MTKITSKPERGATRDGRTGTGTRVIRVLNLRVLGITLVVVAVLGAAAYFWRTYQVRRAADALLDRADQLAQQEDLFLAANYLSRYLRLKPGDADVRLRLARVFDRATEDSPEKRRTIELYQQALGAAEEEQKAEIRRRLGELLLQQGNYAAAQAEADKLLAEDPADAVGARVLALAVYRQVESGALAAGGRDDVAVAQYIRAALELTPGDVELATLLARIYREHVELLDPNEQVLDQDQRHRRADGMVDRMVEADPQSAETRLARCRYRTQYKLPGAEEDLSAALELDPKNVEVLLTAAEFARREAAGGPGQPDSQEKRTARYQQACQYCREAIEADEADERAYYALAGMQLAGRRAAEAAQTCEGYFDESDGTRWPSVRLLCLWAEALLSDDKLKQAEEVLGRAGETLEALDPRVPRDTRQFLGGLYALSRAKWLLKNGSYRDAVPLLRPVAMADLGSPFELAQSREASAILGDAYRAQGLWDLAAGAYQRAAELGPARPEIQLAAADAWQRAGQPQRAVPLLRRALTRADSSQTRLAMAETLLQQASVLPKSQRNWKEVQEALAAARAASLEKGLQEPWRLALLEARYELLRGAGTEDRSLLTGRVLERLRAAEAAEPNAGGLLQRLVVFYGQLGAPEDADRALKRFEKQAEPAAGILLRARLCDYRGQHEEAEKLLRGALPTTDGPQQAALHGELAGLCYRLGRFQDVKQQLLSLHRQRPSDPGVITQLAELALAAAGTDSGKRTDWLREAEKWEGKLREVDLADGGLWRHLRARRLATVAEGPDDPRLAEASKLAAELLAARPAWAPAQVLQGQVLERQGKLSQAVDAYRAAIGLGARGLSVYERLVSLLFRLKRFDELDAQIAKLEDRVLSSKLLESLELRRADMQGDRRLLLQLTRRGTEARPNNPQAWIRYGSALMADGQTEEAKKQFLAALELAAGGRQRERAHRALVEFYLRSKQADAAREQLRALATDQEVPEIQRAMLQAGGLEALGDLPEAEAGYRRAAGLAKNEPPVQLRLAQFLMRSSDPEKMDEAEQLLTRLVGEHPQHGPARRALALTLAYSGQDDKWQKAQEILQQTDSPQADALVDQRLQAVLLARRGGMDNRRKARKILEQLVTSSPSPPAGDRILLARLYELEGRSEPAGQQYRTLVDGANPSPRYLAQYVEFLLRNNQVDAAGPWLDRLQQLAPDDLACAGLRARWLAARGQSAEIEDAVEPVGKRLLAAAETDAKKPARAAAVAELYRRVGRQQAAARWYRQAADVADPAPAHLGGLVAVLLELDEHDEAAKWLKRLETKVPDALETAALRARWHSARGEPAQVEPAVEAVAARLWKGCQEDSEKKARLALAVGGLFGRLERHQAAERWYRKLQGLSPQRYEPLALSLARQGRLADAIRVCQQAAGAGSSPRPAFVLASALLESEVDEEAGKAAEPFFRQALKRHPADVPLRMAVAGLWVRQGKMREAADLYEQIIRAKPKHPLALNNLATVLGESPKRRTEAIQYAERAIEIAGPLPLLLDTKGTILLRAGRAKEAVALLERAVASPDPDPRYQLHLAGAYHQLGQPDKARAALQNARQRNLSGYLMTRTDSQDLEELQRRLTP